MEKIPTDALSNQPDEKKEEKPRVFNIDKGWREQLTPEEVEKIKNWSQKIVRQWHDEANPDYIFLTETSAIPFGYILKETWKAVYGNEKTPSFYRINPQAPLIAKVIERIKNSPELNYLDLLRDYIDEREPENTELFIGEVKDFIINRINKNNPRIIVFDEGRIMDSSDEESENYLKSLTQFTSNTDLSSMMSKAGSSSLTAAVIFLKKMLENESPVVFGSQQALKLILQNKKESEGHYTKSGQLIMKSRLPTSKYWGTSYIGKDDQSEDENRLYRKNNAGRYDELTGKIVKHPKQRKKAIDYVNDLQELGKEAGKELRQRIEEESKYN